MRYEYICSHCGCGFRDAREIPEPLLPQTRFGHGRSITWATKQ